MLGFPNGSDGQESACNAGDLGLIPGQEDPLKRMATHSNILPEESQAQKGMVGHSPGGHKESDMTE